MLQIKAFNEHISYFTVPYKDIFTTVAVIRSEKGSILFDAAFKEADIEQYIMPALEQLGVDDLRYIFISHNHSDHAGGLKWLLPKLPHCKVISRSAALAETYPDHSFILPEDGDVFLEHFQVVTIPGHTPDCAAVLDRRTGTLITGDCLQVYGIYGSGAWGAVICWQKLHLEALKKLDAMDIQAILAAHDYHPYGQTVFGQEAVKAYIGGCLEALLRIRDILKTSLEKTDEEIIEICNDGSLPTVPVKVVANMRKLLEQGGI